MPNEDAFLTVAATPTAEQSAVARAPIGVSDEAMTGMWRVIIARVPDRYVAYYYHENDDARLKAALKLQAERWIASHERVT
jgi:hypothetical protein